MPENFYPHRKPRVNDTGKTIDEVLREAKAEQPTHLISPFKTRLEHDGKIENLKPIRVISIKGFGNLTDEDIAALDPDERIYNEDKPSGERDVRLGDLRVYKAAKRKAAGLPKKLKEEAEAEKLKDSLHGFLGERS